MLTIERKSDTPYQWDIGSVPLAKVANVEHKMPRHFIDAEGFDITPLCYRYLNPLIQGEAYPPYKNGMPEYATLKNKLVEKKLNGVFAL